MNPSKLQNERTYYMALKLEGKKKIVLEVAEHASSALSAAVATYRGLTVNQMNELRKQARKTGVYLKIVRNSLAKIAIQGTEFECISSSLSGQLIIAFSKEEPGSSAKLFRDFAMNNENFVVKNLAISGKIFGPDRLEEMSNLPDRQGALGMLCAIINEPITRLVRTTNEVPSKTVRMFAAVGKSK
jgi:large subunit ribosomal protein L10